MSTQIDNTTPAYVLRTIDERAASARGHLLADDYQEVIFEINLIREHCAHVEKMMWRRINSEREAT